MPFSSACNVVSAWIRGVAAGIDGNAEYRRPKAIAADDEMLRALRTAPPKD